MVVKLFNQALGKNEKKCAFCLCIKTKVTFTNPIILFEIFQIEGWLCESLNGNLSHVTLHFRLKSG